MLKQRVITALILAPVVVIGLFFLPPLGFGIFTGFALTVAAWEWANLAGVTNPKGRVSYALITAVIMMLCIAFSIAVSIVPILWATMLWWMLALYLVVRYPAAVSLWQSVPMRLAMGLVVLVGTWLGLNHLRTGDFSLGRMDNNLLLILFSFCIVWAADIGAYFAGRAWGNRKLAPRVSPGKSWAGVYGGVAAALALAAAVGVAAGCTAGEILLLLFISGITALVSVLGDLYESMLKRFRGIKDSSRLLPGHGGVLDRVDSLTAALPIFALLLTLAGWLRPVI